MPYPINTPERAALMKRRARGEPPAEDEDSELLEDGQEEVFSRTEVESGDIEHKRKAG